MKSIILLAMVMLISAVAPGQVPPDIRLNAMDMEGLKKLLSLSATEYPMLNNPAGYPNE